MVVFVSNFLLFSSFLYPLNEVRNQRKRSLFILFSFSFEFVENKVGGEKRLPKLGMLANKKVLDNKPFCLEYLRALVGFGCEFRFTPSSGMLFN